MGKSSLFIGILIALAGPQALAVTESNLQTILTTTSDAQKNRKCVLELDLNPSGEMTGAELVCLGQNPTHDTYTIDQLRKGVVISHDDSHDIDVMTLSSPDLDVAHGGTVKLHYLSNYVGKSYEDWVGQAINNGGQWTLYTSSDAGHEPFNQLFAAKRTLLGKTVGIKAIQVSWAKATAN
jgi:hypothetical protein